MDRRDSTKIHEEYQSQKSQYSRFCTEVVKQLTELLSSASVTPALPIQYRVKSWNSTLDKLETKGDSLKKLSDLPDIAGIRIVLLFQRDIDKVAAIIEATFKVLRKEDAKDRLGESEFGYGSIHYEVTTPDEWLKVPTLKPLEGIHGEIQVRTAAQHIWAAASHVLQYKSESDVPFPLRRAITRSAALLETVDLEFERVLAEREEYASEINPDDPSETLNTDTLRESLLNLLPKKNISKHEEFSELLKELNHFGISNIGTLKELLSETWEGVLRKENEYVSRKQKEYEETGEVDGTSEDRIMLGVYFTHTGLMRQALSEKYGDELDDYWKSIRKRRELSLISNPALLVPS